MADIQDIFPQTAVAARAGSPAVSASFVTTSTLIAAYLAIGAVLLAFAGHAGPELPGFNALFSGGVFVIEGVTCFLLMVVYRRQPRRSVLLLAAAYLFSALMSLGYLLAYPGAIAPGRPLMGTSQSIAWIYNSWIVGFASLTFAAVLVEVLYGARGRPIARRGCWPLSCRRWRQLRPCCSSLWRSRRATSCRCWRPAARGRR